NDVETTAVMGCLCRAFNVALTVQFNLSPDSNSFSSLSSCFYQLPPQSGILKLLIIGMVPG
ncbi:hypothetical protein, partial [Corynebacterium flavescens]|uniref:hypothetical protein n=1 Tax=Corynebacterium flavescens TaxID=28028 RepID=UPI001C3F824C